MATTTASKVFYETGSQSDIFDQNKVVFLHCITSRRFRVPLSSCKAVGVLVRLCHISIPPNIRVRRGVLFPNQDDMLETTYSTPRLLSVDSSCILSWKDKDDEVIRTMIIWKFTPITTLPMPVQPTVDADTDDTLDSVMPIVPQGECQHCSKGSIQQASSSSASTQNPSSSTAPASVSATTQPQQSTPEQETQTAAPGSSTTPAPGSSTTPAQQVTQTTQPGSSRTQTPASSQDVYEDIFNIMGSWKKKHYQDVLEIMEKQMLAGNEVPVRVAFEPLNREDVNAIKAEAFVEGAWASVGCVIKHKIPKLTVALRQDTILQTTFTKTPKFKYNVNQSGYDGLVVNVRIINQQKWGSDDMSYKYNKDLSHL